MAPLEEVVEAGAIQDFRRPVADFFHDETNATGRFVNTFIAPAICGLTDAWKQRVRTQLDDIPISVISLEHLKQNKQASNRDSDRMHLARLEKYGTETE